MAGSPTKPKFANLARFSVEFTSFAMTWNHCELIAKQIFQLIVGGGREEEPAMAIAAELQNRSLLDIIETIVATQGFEEIRPHIKHFNSGFRRILAYRNFYIHSLMGIEDGVGGLLSLKAGKAGKRLAYRAENLTVEELDRLRIHMMSLIGYGAVIQKELGASGESLDALISSHGATLAMPKWPPKFRAAEFNFK